MHPEGNKENILPVASSFGYKALAFEFLSWKIRPSSLTLVCSLWSSLWNKSNRIHELRACFSWEDVFRWLSECVQYCGTTSREEKVSPFFYVTNKPDKQQEDELKLVTIHHIPRLFSCKRCVTIPGFKKLLCHLKRCVMHDWKIKRMPFYHPLQHSVPWCDLSNGGDKKCIPCWHKWN